jgi:hypothetical protein
MATTFIHPPPYFSESEINGSVRTTALTCLLEFQMSTAFNAFYKERFSFFRATASSPLRKRTRQTGWHSVIVNNEPLDPK